MSTEAPCLCLPALARGKQEALDALPADYYQPDYDPVAGELAMLPRMFTEGDLEAVVEEKSGVLEVHAPTLTRGGGTMMQCTSVPLHQATARPMLTLSQPLAAVHASCHDAFRCSFLC